MNTLGFIGAGNMATAILGGVLSKGKFSKEEVIISAKTDSTISKVEYKFGVKVTKDNKEVVKKSDIIILAVKPNIYDNVLEEVKEYIDTKKIIIAIAAGKTIKNIEDIIGSDKKIIRIMPNTPALIGEGMTSITPNKNIQEGELKEIEELLNSFGKSQIIEESLIDAVIGVSGSSPAYTYMYIEALADGAVLHGMKREQAYKFAAEAVIGAAKMLLETGAHPGELKDMVCSPSGTTIEAVKVLEEEGFRKAVIKAEDACIKKSKEMSSSK
ncbi:MAG: pyrroline-5-carboxylate reductase [Clostridioides sp.]|nr:pyrroline-5-carboxylate reductase [Clostridioides sp.]